MSSQPAHQAIPWQHDPRDPNANPPLDFDTLRFRVQTLGGMLQHYAHLAEEAGLTDTDRRDMNIGKYAAYRHAAHEVAALLWPSDGVS